MPHRYGVYGSGTFETVHTERFVYEMYDHGNGSVGTRLFYDGAAFAVCEYSHGTTRFAYRDYDANTDGTDEEFRELLLSGLIPADISGLTLLEPLEIETSDKPLPLCDGTNFAECLTAWRNGGSLEIYPHMLLFTLVTNKIEYVCQLSQPQDNVYCGASVNKVCIKGMAGGNQYFRLRHLGDDSQPFCRFFASFAHRGADYAIDESLFEVNACSTVGGVNYWSVKRWSEREIVLNGCDGDEYTYAQGGSMQERYR